MARNHGRSKKKIPCRGCKTRFHKSQLVKVTSGPKKTGLCRYCKL